MLTDKEVKQLPKFNDTWEDIVRSVGEDKVNDVHNTELVLAIISKWVINHEQLTHGYDSIDLSEQKRCKPL